MHQNGKSDPDRHQNDADPQHCFKKVTWRIFELMKAVTLSEVTIVEGNSFSAPTIKTGPSDGGPASGGGFAAQEPDALLCLWRPGSGRPRPPLYLMSSRVGRRTGRGRLRAFRRSGLPQVPSRYRNLLKIRFFSWLNWFTWCMISVGPGGSSLEMLWASVASARSVHQSRESLGRCKHCFSVPSVGIFKSCHRHWIFNCMRDIVPAFDNSLRVKNTFSWVLKC